MDIEDLFMNDGMLGPKRFYEFETFILKMLKHHIEDQNKSFELTTESINFGDAYSETGFDKIQGPVLIEIKYDLNRTMRLNFFRDQLIKFSNKTGKQITSFLVISAATVTPLSLKKAEKSINEIRDKFNLIIWGPNEIKQIINKHKRFANEVMNNLFQLRMEAVIQTKSSDWREERKVIISELKERYQRGQFSLFVGAGVSSSAGLPDWNTLLNSMFVNYTTKLLDSGPKVDDNDITQIVKRLSTIDSQTALMTARYIRRGLSEGNVKNYDFNKEVTKQLYKLRDKSKPFASELIKAISLMCTPRRTGAKIKSIVTYNFDDLLERQLNKTYNLNKSIYCENDSFDPDQLPVYHVHGFLPEETQDYLNIDKSTFVFSEEGYHKIYSEPYHWSNLVQLNSLRENNCLMIGLSMTDPNLRRLLDIAARNVAEPKHYAFMKRITLKSFIQDDKETVITNSDGAESFLNNHFKLNEELMKELGVIIIWYESYDEIPLILNQVSNFEV